MPGPRYATGYMAEYVIRTLMSVPITSKVSTVQPIGVSDNASFIVDLEKVKFCDLQCDDMGSWQTTGTKSTYFNIADESVVFTCKSDAGYILKRRYYVHGTYQKYHRMIADVAGMSKV